MVIILFILYVQRSVKSTLWSDYKSHDDAANCKTLIVDVQVLIESVYEYLKQSRRGWMLQCICSRVVCHGVLIHDSISPPQMANILNWEIQQLIESITFSKNVKRASELSKLYWSCGRVSPPKGHGRYHGKYRHLHKTNRTVHSWSLTPSPRGNRVFTSSIVQVQSRPQVRLQRAFGACSSWQGIH